MAQYLNSVPPQTQTPPSVETAPPLPRLDLIQTHNDNVHIWHQLIDYYMTVYHIQSAGDIIDAMPIYDKTAEAAAPPKVCRQRAQIFKHDLTPRELDIEGESWGSTEGDCDRETDPIEDQ